MAVNVIILINIEPGLTTTEAAALVPEFSSSAPLKRLLLAFLPRPLMSLTPTSRLLRRDSPPCCCLEPASASGHGLARPSDTLLPPIKIQRTGPGSAAPPSFTPLTSSWTPRVCAFTGSGGHMDKGFGIIYPDVLFPDAPACPHLHPHLGSSGPVKQNLWKRWILDGNKRRGPLAEPTDLITTSAGVYCISARLQWWLKETLKARVLKKPQDFLHSSVSSVYDPCCWFQGRVNLLEQRRLSSPPVWPKKWTLWRESWDDFL